MASAAGSDGATRRRAVRRLNFWGGRGTTRRRQRRRSGGWRAPRADEAGAPGDRCRTDALSMLVNARGRVEEARGRGRGAARAHRRNAQVSD
jgi:hypothetical protein